LGRKSAFEKPILGVGEKQNAFEFPILNAACIAPDHPWVVETQGFQSAAVQAYHAWLATSERASDR